MRASEEILRGVGEVLREHLDWQGPLDRDLRLIEDLQLDSVRLLTLAVEVENRFQVRLAEADEAAIVTLGDLVDVVREKLDA